MQRHTETKKRWLRLFKKHGSDQWQCLISCEWAQTHWDQNIFPSLCVCVILTCSQPPTLSWSVRVPPMGGAVESQWEEKGQSRRNFLRQKEVWQMHKHTLTHTQRERGREGRSRSCWSSLLLLPPPPRRLRAGGVYLAVFGLSGRGSVIVQQHPAVLFGWVSVSGAGSFPRLCAASVWSPASRFQRIAPSCHSQLVPSSVQTPSPSLLTYEI